MLDAVVDAKDSTFAMAAVPPYDEALSRVREVLRSLVLTGLRLPIATELKDAVRDAAHSALRDQVPLPVVSADLGRLAAETMLGDPQAVEVGLAMARRAVREYHELEDGGTGPTS